MENCWSFKSGCSLLRGGVFSGPEGSARMTTFCSPNPPAWGRGRGIWVYYFSFHGSVRYEGVCIGSERKLLSL